MTHSSNTASANQTTILSVPIDVLVARIQFVGIVTIFVLGFTYLLMMNSLATKGFVLEGFKADRIALQKELEVVDIEMAIPTSLYALESSEMIQEMPNVGQKLFLMVDPNGMVAYEGQDSLRTN